MEVIIAIISFFGALFVLIAAIGMVRMPDTYLRISVATMASTLGVGLLLIGAILFFEDSLITIRAIAIMVFIVMTTPVSEHLIARSTYLMKIKLWKKSVMDDLEGKFDADTDSFKGMEENPEEEK